MKAITKILSLIMLSGAFVGCTIVMPAVDTGNTSKGTTSTSEGDKPTRPTTSYTRPTPTTTVNTQPDPVYTRPRPAHQETTPVYTRPTPTTTVNTKPTPVYTRPTPTTTTGSSSTSKDVRSDGRIDSPAGKESYTGSVADTTKVVRSRVRR